MFSPHTPNAREITRRIELGNSGWIGESFSMIAWTKFERCIFGGVGGIDSRLFVKETTKQLWKPWMAGLLCKNV